MGTRSTVLAVDLGAESGRVVAAQLHGSQVTLDVAHRFPNRPVQVRGTLHWDLLRLWAEIQDGISACVDRKPAAIGVDTWGVDFGLLDRQGHLLGNPVHYRDARTDGMLQKAFERVPRPEVFEATGIQFLPINSLIQLVSMVESDHPALRDAATFLTIPDLLNFWLTGEKASEFTNATTTQCYDPRRGGWAAGMLARMGIPTEMFPAIVQPGTRLGAYDNIPVVLPACHDTGSAVAAVPTESRRFAYLSSGTWSLLGLEVPQAILSQEALAANLTNEGGVCGTFRLLKNIMGLWIIQQCRATWAAQGKSYEYHVLAEMARSAPSFAAFVDPDDNAFLPPGDMPARIASFCMRTGQAPPEGVSAVARCVFESLALKYRCVLDTLINVSGQEVDVIHVIGGGSQNELLCQMTANATRRPVVAGPTEATAFGNALMQWLGLGELATIEECRTLVRHSVELKTYQPLDASMWDEALGRYKDVLARAG
jgi:rhamnulokinase